jgi:hypothetical protein
MPRAITRLGALAIALLVLAGCATHDPKPAVCDGKHRRPANPYGSVLPSIPGADASTPTAAPSPTPRAARPPGPQSSIDPRSFARCGVGA